MNHQLIEDTGAQAVVVGVTSRVNEAQKFAHRARYAGALQINADHLPPVAKAMRVATPCVQLVADFLLRENAA